MPQQKTLRGLAKAYANGLIEKDEYRRERAAYLEAVLAGETRLPVPPVVPLPGATRREKPLENLAAPADADVAALRQPGGDVRPGGGNSRHALIAGGAALLVALAAAVFLLGGGEESAAPPAGANPPAAFEEAPPSPAQNLIAGFLADNAWSQADMNSFLADWQALPAGERDAARRSIEFSQLGNAIYKKLLEERALSRIGNPETAYEKQRQFVQFAASIGIEDPRISMPDRAMESMN